MPGSLEDKIQRYGNVADMLRNVQVGAYTYPMKPEFSNWRDEQAAWKNTAVLFDQSFHMTDVYFRGPDVLRLLSDLGVNTFKNFGKNKAKQFVACNYDGYVIGDAILFGLDDEEFSLVGRPIAPDWVAFHAETGDYDVKVVRDERSVANQGRRLTFRYQLQGPSALKIVEKAVGKYDFDTLIGGHLTRLGRREDVETQREYVTDLRREALRALAEVDQLPSWQYVHNVYGMFTNHFNRIASQVAEELLPKWKGRLAGVDFFIHNHSFIMLEALRVDWNAEPFVVLPPPSLITEGN